MRKKLSRLGIFVFYDPQGIVDDYVLFLLKSLRPHFARIITVSNSELDETGKERLKQYSDALFIRENVGLDAAAYKAGLVSYCGWDEVEKYDEVVLLNDTFFGPIRSFSDMFEEMSERDVDFWGMSAGYHSIDGWNKVKYKFVPDHIQTFFVAFRRNMVSTEAFHSYWENYNDTLHDFVSVVTQHEVIMTKHFQDLGFRWDIYADTSHYSAKRHSENFNIYHFHPDKMMRDMKFPVLKKKTLNVDIFDQLYMQDLESGFDAMQYIHSETDYDTNLIWDNILRLYNVSNLYYTLHLNYVLPSMQAPMPKDRKIALVYRVINPFFAEQFCKHAKGISEVTDVYIIPEGEDTKRIVMQNVGEKHNITVLKPSRQKTEMGSFVLCCKDLAAQYDYLGFIHDAENADYDPIAVIESSVYGILQNIANDPTYVSQIINCFEENPRLGVLGIPFSVHHYDFGNYGNEWGDYFKAVKALSLELGLQCNLDEKTQPFMVSGAFWCRTKAIRNIWNRNWSAQQFHLNHLSNVSVMNEALKRILPYVAQSERYYSGIVMHTNYASMRIANQQHMLDQIVGITSTQLGCASNRYKGYIDQLKSINNGDPGSSMMIDLSRFSMGSIIRIYLERHAPPWVIQTAMKIYRFFRGSAQ